MCIAKPKNLELAKLHLDPVSTEIVELQSTKSSRSRVSFKVLEVEDNFYPRRSGSLIDYHVDMMVA